MYTRPPIGSCATAELIFCPMSDPCSSAALIALEDPRETEGWAIQVEANKSKQTSGGGIRKTIILRCLRHRPKLLPILCLTANKSRRDIASYRLLHSSNKNVQSSILQGSILQES